MVFAGRASFPGAPRRPHSHACGYLQRRTRRRAAVMSLVRLRNVARFMRRRRTTHRASMHLIIGFTMCACVAGAVVAAIARPNRYGHSDREERHMFPAVSTGPLDPAWSPDG